MLPLEDIEESSLAAERRSHDVPMSGARGLGRGQGEVQIFKDGWIRTTDSRIGMVPVESALGDINDRRGGRIGTHGACVKVPNQLDRIGDSI